MVNTPHVDIYLFDSLKKGKRTEQSDANAHLAGLEALENKHLRQDLFHRKFLAFVNKERSSIVLVVGPVFSREPQRNFYYHKDLLLPWRSCRIEDHVQSGGGEIVFSRDRDQKAAPWKATFGDYSEAFGVYDPIVLLVRDQIMATFGVPMTFSWSDSSP